MSGLLGGDLHSLACLSFTSFLECGPHTSPLSIPAAPQTNSLHSDISPKDKLKHTSVYRHLLVEPFSDCSQKGGRKGVKGHLKAKVNGDAF